MTPATWKRTTIGAIARVTSGGTPSREVPAYWNGVVPWITTSLIDFNTIVDADEFITKEATKNSSAKVYPAGTLLMAMFGQGVTRGKVAMLGIDAAFNQACVAIMPKYGISSRFLFHNLAARYEEIRKLSNIGSQENLNATLIKSITLDLPPPEEVERIVQVADAWDRGIRQLADLIAAKVRFKRGLMQQLLTGKRRFPEFGGEWRSVRLRDVATINAEVLPNNCDSDYEFHYIDLSSVTTGSIRLPEDKIRFSEAPSRARRVVRDRDVLLATVRPNLKGFALYRGDGKNVICSTGFAVISANRPDDSDYLWHLTLSDDVTQQLAGRIAGSNFPAVSASDVENLVVPFPPDDRERDQISRALSLIDREVTNLRRQLAALKLQKRGLMQKLLTGEVRVKLPEEAA